MAELDKVGRYALLEELGRGGMSTVYLAHDERLEREVAVKLLHPHLASRDESRVRFQREARTVARLRHPNIVEIFDFSEEDAEQSYIVVEYIRGRTLRQFVDEVGIDTPEIAAAITLELCKALAYAHENKIIHRDIKPENVMIDEDGSVKLMDFGIARLLDADTMTATGSLLGSPAHMPPEMIDGLPTDHRGDIFSLGTVLYYLITNILPFTGRHPSAVLRNILEGKYVDPQQFCPRLGRGLAQIVERCMAAKPDDRYASVQDVLEALRAELEDLALEDSEDLVKAFFADPSGYEAALEPRLVSRLIARAEDSIEARELPRASDYLNRVFAIDPDHAEALALLERMRSGRRKRNLLIAAVLMVVISGTAFAISSWVKPPAFTPDSKPVAETPKSDVPPETAASGVATLPDLQPLLTATAASVSRGWALGRPRVSPVLQQVRPALVVASSIGAVWGVAYPASKTPSGESRSPREPRENPREPVEGGEGTQTDPQGDPIGTEPVETAPRWGEVSFSVTPVRQVVARVEGKPLFRDTGEGRIVVRMTPGEHEVSFDCPKCVSERHQVTVGPGPREHSTPINLRWKGASVKMEAADPAHYYIVKVEYGRDKQKSMLFPANSGWDFSISGSYFNWKGDPLQVKIFAVPEDQRVPRREEDPPGITPVQIPVEPGDRRTYVRD